MHEIERDTGATLVKLAAEKAVSERLKTIAAEYVLLPARGLRSPEMVGLWHENKAFGVALTHRLGPSVAKSKPGWDQVNIVHSMHEDGPKLAALTTDELLALRISNPGVRAIPLVYYELARPPIVEVARRAKVASSAPGVALQVTIVRSADRKPVVGARVVALTDFDKRDGEDDITDSNGVARLPLGSNRVTLDALIVYGPPGYWGAYHRNIEVVSGDQVPVDPIDLSEQDFLAEKYGTRAANAGAGIKVGVIDTGIALDHSDLSVSSGGAFVARENDAGGFGPATTDGDHGSHVAGIVASRGQAPQGKRGVAPGVTLLSYRVFGNDGQGATNYDILRAIEQGVRDGCDLLNLSLQLGTPDDAVRDAIKGAFDQGTVCIVAAGNDGRQPVAFPAKWPECVAVSAAGKIGTYPKTSTEAMEEKPPFAPTDPQIYIAAFSNIGPEIHCTAPGVGIVSTVPGGNYAVMSGTSMACPAITGLAASLLEQNPAILRMARNQARSAAVKGLISAAAQSVGLPPEYEGLGMVG